MIDPTTLATARAAFAAIDVTAENEQIAALEAERERISDALAKAEERVTEISAGLAAYLAADRGEAIAYAMSAKVDPTEASNAGPSREKLIEERGAINAGMANLRKRYDATYDAIRQIQTDAFAKVQAAAKPMVAALLAQAENAAQRIADAYAGLDAITGASRAGSGERERVGSALARITGTRGLLVREPIAVNGEIVTTLRELQGRGAALPVGIREASIAPDDLQSVALIAGATAGLSKAA